MKLINQNKTYSFISILIVVLFIYVSDIYIYQVVGEAYAYMYKFKLEFSYFRLFITIPMIFIISYFSLQQLRRSTYSDIFILIINFMYFLPSLIMIMYGGFSDGYIAFHILSFLSLSLVNQYFPGISLNHNLKRSRFSISQFTLFSLLVAALAAIIVVHYNGFNIKLNLDDVYSMRKELYYSSMPNIFNYYLPYVARFIPIVMAFFLARKRFFVVFFLTLVQLILFSFGGLKYVLFALILSFLVYFYSKRKSLSSLILGGICLLHFFAVIEILFVDTPIISVLINRRISFVPNQIGYFYFDFFSKNGYLFYSESFLRAFLDYSYPMNVPHTIANYAFGLPDMGANTGLMSEGFAQIGWLAFIVYPLMYVIAFRFYDDAFRNLQQTNVGNKMAVIGVLLYAISFIDGAFFSILLTQGFFLNVISFYLIPRKI